MIIHFLSWWYGPGIKRTIAQTDKRALGVLDDFSVGLLARTWFAPFRQIDAGNVRGSMQVQLQAWFGRTFSRFFGAGLRTIMIITGLIAAALTWLFGMLWLLLWPLLPLLPIAGAVLWAMGVTL